MKQLAEPPKNIKNLGNKTPLFYMFLALQKRQNAR
jgi:hypothetical protein